MRIETLAHKNKVSEIESVLWEYLRVRRMTERLCEPLETEDYGVQSMPAASPVKWHLGHTSWFFETFILMPFRPGYKLFHPCYTRFFNSYYHSAGTPYDRSLRGVWTRPTVRAIYAYRQHVDEEMFGFLKSLDTLSAEAGQRIRTGIHHEQQHQELILTDIKHAFSLNPMRPAYHTLPRESSSEPVKLKWVEFPEDSLAFVGFDGDGFCFDNELPRHQAVFRPFSAASRLVTNREFLDFMEDDGYTRPELWLSDGWKWIQEEGIKSPLYWDEGEGSWHVMSLAGIVPLDEHEPAAHVSYYEADAYARWAQARLLTEEEWEFAAQGRPLDGNFLEGGRFHPLVCEKTGSEQSVHQLLGDVWEWTSSPYKAYPGYQKTAGPLGEYNGKFMCNQMVLRGGSCVSPETHIRPSYRNFFHPPTRWQFSGIRLARDLKGT